MRVWIRRLTPFLPMLGCVVLAVMLTGAASSYSTLDCERSAGLCVVERRAFFTTSQHRLWMESVAEVRYVGKLGKSRDRGRTQLVFMNGHHYDLASGEEDDARRRHAELEAFFAGRGSSLYLEDRGSWFYLAAAASVVAAIALAVRGARRRLVVTVAAPRPPSPVGARLRHLFARRDVRIFGLIIVGAVAIQITWQLWAGHSQGLLLLDCQKRCRFQGLECLPGGRVQMGLEPGPYTIEVWRPQGDGRLWQPRTVTIERGETTTFVCGSD